MLAVAPGGQPHRARNEAMRDRRSAAAITVIAPETDHQSQSRTSEFLAHKRAANHLKTESHQGRVSRRTLPLARP